MLDYDVSLHNLVVLDVTIPTSPRLSKTEFICKSYGVLFSLFGSGPEMVRSLRSHRSLRPSGPESPVLRVSLPIDFVWCGTGLGSGGTPEMVRSLRPKGPGISGPRFSQLVCVFVVRYWIGVRNTPGEGPESPPLGTGISGPPRGSRVPGAWPECPAQARVSDPLTSESPA